MREDDERSAILDSRSTTTLRERIFTYLIPGGSDLMRLWSGLLKGSSTPSPSSLRVYRLSACREPAAFDVWRDTYSVQHSSSSRSTATLLDVRQVLRLPVSSPKTRREYLSSIPATTPRAYPLISTNYSLRDGCEAAWNLSPPSTDWIYGPNRHGERMGDLSKTILQAYLRSAMLDMNLQAKERMLNPWQILTSTA